MPQQSVFCGQCGAELKEPPGLPIDERAPCPACGSKSRNHKVSLDGSITPRGTLSYKARHGKGKKPHKDGIVGASWSRRLIKWLRIERLIDRDGDLYEEKVTDPETGAVIHYQKEPLTQHTDHGAAKKDRT